MKPSLVDNILTYNKFSAALHRCLEDRVLKYLRFLSGVGCALILSFLSPFPHNLKPISFQDHPVKVFNSSGSGEPICQSRNRLSILLDNSSQLGFSRVAVRRVEDGPEVFSDLTAHLLSWHVSASVLLKVALAALPEHSAKDSDASSFQSSMVIAGELSAVQARCHQALQEDPPVNFMLALGKGDAQDLPPDIIYHTDSH